MSQPCQVPEPFAIAVSGVAGSGKSTLGWALARSLRAPLIDLDSVTNPLLDQLPAEMMGGHWLSSPHSSAIRRGRYAALRATARDALAATGRAVLVAPFTAELSGGPEWEALRQCVAPAEPRIVQLVGDPDLFAARRRRRGEVRDQHRQPDPGTVPSAGVPVITIDAELSTDQQLARLWPRLGRRTPMEAANPLFASTFEAVLFDLDGTLVDSTASVMRSWRRFAREFTVSMEKLHTNHGQPAKRLVELVLEPDQVQSGIERITELEVADASTVTAILGARDLFATVPPARRAIVTSGSVPIATARLRAARIPVPDTLITVEDVVHGKPAPDPYLVAARRLGVDPRRCLVVEDAAAGVQSARAAGCQVLALTGTAAATELDGAAMIIDGLDRVAVESVPGGVRLAPRII